MLRSVLRCLSCGSFHLTVRTMVNARRCVLNVIVKHMIGDAETRVFIMFTLHITRRMFNIENNNFVDLHVTMYNLKLPESRL